MYSTRFPEHVEPTHFYMLFILLYFQLDKPENCHIQLNKHLE